MLRSSWPGCWVSYSPWRLLEQAPGAVECKLCRREAAYITRRRRSAMRFVPRFTDGQEFSQSLGKIVCIGRNYADHAKELNNPVPTEPLLFIKPATSAVHFDELLEPPYNRGEVHYEAELALLIGERLTHATADEAERAIVGIGMALDLTLRDLQTQLKEKGHPWEIAKSFDGACPLSDFMPLNRVPNWNALVFELEIDGELRQRGEVSEIGRASCRERV